MPRILLTMATGTGKTVVAFQICWKLWNSRWNKTEEHRRPRILYLADRNILIDDPMAKTFAPFGDARWKIAGGNAIKSREMYFATYQSIAADSNRPGLYREFPADFFDAIVIDECHRGSAREDSNWREILTHFSSASQVGMTATPRRQDNADTYDYFGDPIYSYSLRQGIEEGFLAPYRVHRIVTTWDAVGWRPSQGELDRFGRAIPDEEYQTTEFEKIVALKARTDAVAKHLTEFLKRTDRFAKTIIFCVDQEHADEMRRALNNLNADLVRDFSDYVCRVTSDEGEIGRGHLSNFQDLERRTPVILTTSQLLTTGVDAPTVQNVVLLRVINSMTEFKQIIGRGTRVRDDYGKLFFSILDYTGSATRLFADPDFDGDPSSETEISIDESGEVTSEVDDEAIHEPPREYDPTVRLPPDEDDAPRRKFYFDGGEVEIAAHLVYELDPDGNQLRVVQFTDYTADKVRTLYRNAAELRNEWADPEKRREIIDRLEERGIDFDHLAETANQPDADPLDLICHLAFNAPLRTRRERAQRLRSEQPDFFKQYGDEARQILEDLLDKYTEHGTAQFVIPDILELPPINAHGNVIEIAKRFGGIESLRDAAGDSGEFYTPRPVIQFMVTVTNPQLGEVVLDPACGTGGFLAEAFSHLEKQCKTVQDRKVLQDRSIAGGEAKPLPYMLAQMNLLLHGLDAPAIEYGNSLAVKITELGPSDQVDLILTNPPFGGEEEAGIRNNFPAAKQTSETALLFLQLIMRRLKKPRSGNENGGRAAIIVPNGTLFGDGVCARIKEDLLKEFNLHTIVRLPNGVFAPYTAIPTNLLFFDRSGTTKDIWYYELPMPDGRKNYSKTKPVQFDEFADCIKLFQSKRRKEDDHAWKVPAKSVLKYDKAGNLLACNLDQKNPSSADALVHLPPEQLADDILAKERRIIEIMEEIKAELAGNNHQPQAASPRL